MPIITTIQEAQTRESRFEAGSDKKLVSSPPPISINKLAWCMSVIPVMWEAQVGGLQFKIALGKKYKTPSQKKLKQKGMGTWLKC
jgi:hypothetical protein